MNSSSSIDSSLFVQNSTMIIVESWFIPLDIFKIVCSILIIILSTFFLLIIILDKTCHTVPMMLIANTYLCGVINGCNLLGMGIFTFQNDLKQIQYEDSFCVLRFYILYTAGASYNYSFVLQALYRYLIAMYPSRLLFQSFRFQILIIGSSWLYCFVYPFAVLFDGEIIYMVDNQICQIPLCFTYSEIYMVCCGYMIPMSLIRLIYWKLTRHVRKMGENVAATNTLIRAQRELKMVRRILTVITILLIIGFPYTLFMFMGFFNHAPKYYIRISLIFFNVAGLTSEIILFQFTDPLKVAVMKRIKSRPNRILATMT